METSTFVSQFSAFSLYETVTDTGIRDLTGRKIEELNLCIPGDLISNFWQEWQENNREDIFGCVASIGSEDGGIPDFDGNVYITIRLKQDIVPVEAFWDLANPF